MTAPDFRAVLGLRSVLGEPPARASTRDDHFEYLEAGLTPLTCGACGAVVRVQKSSPKHTSIQWTPSAERTCPLLAEHLRTSGTTAFVDGCARLGEEIAAAVRDGRLDVGTSEVFDLEEARDG
jgi:hypothetical protein